MKFEEYIQNICPSLDVDQPDEERIWTGISASLNAQAKQRRIQNWIFALLVASMMFIAFSGGYYIKKMDKNLHVAVSNMTCIERKMYYDIDCSINYFVI